MRQVFARLRSLFGRRLPLARFGGWVYLARGRAGGIHLQALHGQLVDDDPLGQQIGDAHRAGQPIDLDGIVAGLVPVSDLQSGDRDRAARQAQVGRCDVDLRPDGLGELPFDHFAKQHIRQQQLHAAEQDDHDDRRDQPALAKQRGLGLQRFGQRGFLFAERDAHQQADDHVAAYLLHGLAAILRLDQRPLGGPDHPGQHPAHDNADHQRHRQAADEAVDVQIQQGRHRGGRQAAEQALGAMDDGVADLVGHRRQGHTQHLAHQKAQRGHSGVGVQQHQKNHAGQQRQVEPGRHPDPHAQQAAQKDLRGTGPAANRLAQLAKKLQRSHFRPFPFHCAQRRTPTGRPAPPTRQLTALYTSALEARASPEIRRSHYRLPPGIGKSGMIQVQDTLGRGPGDPRAASGGPSIQPAGRLTSLGRKPVDSERENTKSPVRGD